jgi:hypothetical protein
MLEMKQTRHILCSQKRDKFVNRQVLVSNRRMLRKLYRIEMCYLELHKSNQFITAFLKCLLNPCSKKTKLAHACLPSHARGINRKIIVQASWAKMQDSI